MKTLPHPHRFDQRDLTEEYREYLSLAGALGRLPSEAAYDDYLASRQAEDAYPDRHPDECPEPAPGPEYEPTEEDWAEIRG